MHSVLSFFSKTSKIRIYELKFFKLQPFQYFAIIFNSINDDAFLSTVMADACSMVHLVWLFMNMHLLALLQDNCLDLIRCAFLHKFSACVRNITAFCQHLPRLIKSAILADTNVSVKPKYQPDISARPIDRSISNRH